MTCRALFRLRRPATPNSVLARADEKNGILAILKCMRLLKRGASSVFRDSDDVVSPVVIAR